MFVFVPIYHLPVQLTCLLDWLAASSLVSLSVHSVGTGFAHSIQALESGVLREAVGGLGRGNGRGPTEPGVRWQYCCPPQGLSFENLSSQLDGGIWEALEREDPYGFGPGPYF